jgi:hypothetical protein
MENRSMKTPQTPKAAVARRGLLLGAGVAGMAAVAATKLIPSQTVQPEAAAQPKPADTEGGYRLTAHVQRYYQTTKV